MKIPLTHIDIAEDFYDFLQEAKSAKSNMAPYYVKAIHIVNAILKSKYPELLGQTQDLWLSTDPRQIEAVRQFVLTESKKPDGGIFAECDSPSYWKHNFCSAALSAFIPFQQLTNRKKDMLVVAEKSNDPTQLAKELEYFNLFVDCSRKDDVGIAINDLEGKDRIVVSKARENQQKFRTIVLWNYQNKCCISGLPIVHSLQASHIIDWSANKAMRLNPTNGLCLAAHYHLAFDNHLITLDEQYRLVISKSLRDYVNNEAFKDQFMKYEGKQIRMPKRYNPSQTLLAKHREQLV